MGMFMWLTHVPVVAVATKLCNWRVNDMNYGPRSAHSNFL